MVALRLLLVVLLAACSGDDTGLEARSPSPLSLVIEWVAPTKNVDGTPLTDLAGYRVTYSPGTTVNVPATQTTLTIGSVAPGTYSVTVRAVNTAGDVSAPAGPVSVVK